MLKTLTIISLVFLVSCGLDHTPVVYVSQEGSIGVEAWSKLGFVATSEDPGLCECDRTWYSDTFESECQITINLKFVEGLTDDDVNGAEVHGKVDFDTRLVQINTRLYGDHLQHVLTHEIGHILLDSMHLDSYLHPSWENVGIMSSQATWLLEPTVNDYALACHTIGVCVN